MRKFWLPEYDLYQLGKNGQKEEKTTFNAETDRDALLVAREREIDERGMELWEGRRIVARLAMPDPEWDDPTWLAHYRQQT